MAALVVVAGVNVVDHLCAQFNNRDPFVPVQWLCLHSRPKRPDHGVVVAVADSSRAESETVFVDVTGERPGGELGSVVGVDDSPDGWLLAGVGHEQGRVDQACLWPPVNRPTNSFPDSYIRYDADVNGSFDQWMFCDVGHP